MVKLLSWIVPLLFYCQLAFADIFTVTSNADSGPGTLREAITLAAVNGIAVRDSIIFSIADNSESGRTITLLSALPVLSSNMVINGASQSGAPIGVSDARILLFHGATPENFIFLEMHDCADVGIYGMAMINVSDATGNGNIVAGISYVRCHNIQIGRPNAGNYIFGCSHSINSNTARYPYYVYADTSRLITIQSNIIGLDRTGGFSNKYNGVQVTIMFLSVSLLNTSDITIGGDNPAEGNTIVQEVSIPFSYPGGSGYNINIETYRDVGGGLLKIKNNKLGTRKDGSLDPAYRLFQVSIAVQCNFRADYTVQIQDNILQGQIYLYQLGNYFTIQGNTIFSPYTNEVYDCTITVMNCPGGGLIGGDNAGEPNTITNAYTDTVYYFEDHNWEASIRFDLTSHVTIKRNITLCNSYHGSGMRDDDGGNYYNTDAYARVDYTTVNLVKGKATPNTRVDVYLDDDCDACEGKQYLGFVMANADSSWQYTGTFNTGIVATSTSLTSGKTSEFSAPQIVDYGVKIKQPSCGKNNGYVKGLQISGGDNVKWHYMYQKNGVWMDSIYSRSPDLVNAGPGIYFFDAWLGKNCRSAYKRYDLTDTRLTVDSTYLTTQSPSCGKFNGFIKGLYLPNRLDVGVYWENESGTIVSRQLDLTGVGSGKYKLVFQDTVTGCGDSTGVYELVSISGPVININNIRITGTTCHQSDGSIGNIQFTNITGVPYYEWIDSNNKVVGTSSSLNNVPAGDYRLKFKDGGPCDTILTPVFTIGTTGTIVFDSSSLTIQPSQCSSPTGSILGLRVQNGLTYTWLREPEAIAVGANSDLSGIGPGNYKLIATSTIGCIDSSRLFVVSQTPVIPLIASNVFIKQETCEGKNARVYLNDISPDPGGYSFQWIDSTTQLQVSTGQGIDHVGAGTYFCYATDPNGCRQLCWTSRLTDYPAARIDVSGALVYPDTCLLQAGGVDGLKVSGSGPFTYSWYNETGQIVAVTPDLTGAGPGIYQLVVQDGNTCTSNSPPFTVTELEVLPVAPQYPVYYTLKNTAVEVKANHPENGNYELYENTSVSLPDQQNKTGTFSIGPVSRDTTVYVLLRKGDCSSIFTPVTIQVLETLELLVPNAFTPNGDGHNDVFRIKNPGLVRTFEMEIFNRWGEKVFATADPFSGWTGQQNGRISSTGTYVWAIHYTDILGNKKEKAGTVILLR